jgi:hypothetical protein
MLGAIMTFLMTKRPISASKTPLIGPLFLRNQDGRAARPRIPLHFTPACRVQFKFGLAKGVFGVDRKGNIIPKWHISVSRCHA